VGFGVCADNTLKGTCNLSASVELKHVNGAPVSTKGCKNPKTRYFDAIKNVRANGLGPPP